MKTQGHLSNNMGIRGHSVGEFFPFRVIAKGTFDELKWYVIHPDGHTTEGSWDLVKDACDAARLAFQEWSIGHEETK